MIEHRVSFPLKVWVGLVVLLLLAPTLVVIPVSFGASNSFVFPPEEWSLRWYVNFFTDPRWVASLLNSLQVGLLSALLATTVGVFAAIGLSNLRFKGKGLIRGAFLAPQIVPGIVVAVAIYIVALGLNLNGTMLGFVIAHAVIALPFVIITVTTSLAGFDRTVELASRSLGASAFTTFRRITLPLLMPGVASGFAFAFVTSFDEVVIALFMQTPSLRTLPVQMYESITLQIDPTIAAASSLIVVITTGALLLWHLSPKKKKVIS